MVVYPAQGLDAKAINHTWQLLMRLRESLTAVLLVSEDLDKLMALSDRIAVMSKGHIVGLFAASAATREKLGLMIATGGK